MPATFLLSLATYTSGERHLLIWCSLMPQQFRSSSLHVDIILGAWTMYCESSINLLSAFSLKRKIFPTHERLCACGEERFPHVFPNHGRTCLLCSVNVPHQWIAVNILIMFGYTTQYNPRLKIALLAWYYTNRYLVFVKINGQGCRSGSQFQWYFGWYLMQLSCGSTPTQEQFPFAGE